MTPPVSAAVGRAFGLQSCMAGESVGAGFRRVKRFVAWKHHEWISRSFRLTLLVARGNIPAMDCTICTKVIPAPRLEVQPRVVTCSAECSRLLNKRHRLAAARRSNERKRQAKLAAQRES